MKRLLILVCLILVTWGASPDAQTTRYVYLSPVDGDGTESDPFRSRSESEQLAGRGCIDLRPRGFSRYLCASNALPDDMTGVQQLGASLSATITPVRKLAIEAIIGSPLAGNTPRELIIEIIQGHLRAGKDGKLKIWLGESTPEYQQTAGVPFPDNGMVADIRNFSGSVLEPALAWAASIAEDWNCSDNASPTCDLTWTEFNGTDWAIVSNQAAASTTSGQDEARAGTSLDGENHWSQATIVSVSSDASGTSRCGPIARKEANSTRTYVTLSAIHNSGAFTSYSMDKRVAGTLSVITSNATDPVAGEVARIYADGTSYSGYVDGVLRIGPTTDVEAGLATGSNLQGGIYYSWNGTGSMACTLDDFSAQDITASTGRNRGSMWFN